MTVIVTYVVLLGAPGAIETAEGCTAGAPSIEPGYSLSFPYTATGSIPVGRDGFVTLNVDGEGLAPEAVLDQISIEVRDAEGELVSGQAKELRSVQNVESFSVTVGWEADAELPADEVLTVQAVAGGPAKTAKLLVQNRAPELRPLSPTLDEWRMVTRDTGPEVSCIAETTCGPYEFNVGKEVEQVTVASLTLEFPDAPVTVAWTFTTEEVAGKGTLVASQTWDTMNHRLGLGDVAFRGDLETYCVRVVARDLRDGETFSSEACGVPGRGLLELNEDRIDHCLAPPKGLEGRWCGENPERDECQEVDQDPSAGGASGSSGGPPGTDSGSEVAPERESNKESGCSVVAPAKHRNALSAVVFALTLAASFFARRRRSTS